MFQTVDIAKSEQTAIFQRLDLQKFHFCICQNFREASLEIEEHEGVKIFHVTPPNSKVRASYMLTTADICNILNIQGLQLESG